MHSPRTFVGAISLCGALALVACGGSDDTADADLVTAPPATSTETTVEHTTTIATTTTPPPTTTTAPPSTTIASTTTVVVTPDYCDTAGPLPGGATLDSSLTLDITGDGTADDLIEAYDVDGWSRLRLTTGESVVSEIINPAIDGRYRPLGTASVFPGDSTELFAVNGEGSAATEVGVFGTDAAGCLFAYTYVDSIDQFTMLIRPASPTRSGAFCFDGGIGLFGASQESDGTWTADSAAYESVTPGTVQYLGASDDFSEGLDESDLTPFEFDCFDLEL